MMAGGDDVSVAMAAAADGAGLPGRAASFGARKDRLTIVIVAAFGTAVFTEHPEPVELFEFGHRQAGGG